LLNTNRREILADLRIGLDKTSEIAARMMALSGQQDLLNRQIALLRYGPGSPETPCLASEGFGFRFAHYRGLVYALRKPLELDNLSRGIPELLAVHGPDDVIVGDTLDGVRARVEISEGLRDVRAELAAVDRALLSTNRELAERLSQVDSAVLAHNRYVSERLSQVDSAIQAHTYNLEELGRHWWDRLFNH
jgi:hypothetical protein